MGGGQKFLRRLQFVRRHLENCVSVSRHEELPRRFSRDEELRRRPADLRLQPSETGEFSVGKRRSETLGDRRWNKCVC